MKLKLPRLPSVPPFLDVDLTNACNASCPFCSVNATKRKRQGELSGIEWLQFFESLKDLPLFRVSLLGGEPLLVKEIYQIIAALRRENVDVRISTNGLALSKNTVMRLKESDVSMLQISLDAPDSQAHDKSRGRRGLFDRAIEGIKLAKELKLKCIINFLVMKSTIKYVPKMCELAKTLGVPLAYSEFKPVGYGKDWVNEAVDLDDIRAVSKYDETPGIVVGPFFEVAKQDQYCNVGLDRLYISEVGDVFPCDLFRDYKPVYLGNIRDLALTDIWLNASYLNWLRFRQLVGPIEGACRGCEMGGSCLGGCHALAAIHSSNPFFGDPRCADVQNGKERGNTSEGRVELLSG